MSGDPPHLWSHRIEALGRFIVLGLTLFIPLVFFRETYYIFQIKTTLLQLGGWALAALILLRSLFKDRKEFLGGLPIWALFPFAWIFWVSFKSWNSISPEISWREASWLIWLPLFCIATLLFFKANRSKNKLLNTVVLAASVATVYAFIIRFEWVRDTLFQPNAPTVDLFDLPVLNWLLKAFFFPPELIEVFNEGAKKITTDNHQILPIGPQSFFPGKPEAGTFGNKNFLAGFINLTLPLILWKIWTSMPQPNKNFGRREYLITASLSLIIALQFSLLVLIGNRASWLGLIGALLAIPVILLTRKVSWRKAYRWAILPLLLLAVLLTAQPERASSIINPFQASTELRLLTWQSWLSGFHHDNSWEGFESKAWRWATGWGTYSFQVAYPKYRSDRIFKIEHNQHSSETSHAHNHPLNTLGELGVVGLSLELILFLGPLIFLALSLRKREEGWLLPSVIGLALFTQIIQSCFSVAPRYTGVAFQTWLTLSMLMIFLNDPKRNANKRKAPLWLAPITSILCLFMMPNPTWPFSWLQSQHLHAQALTYQSKSKDHHQNAHSLQKRLTKEDASMSREEKGQLIRNLSHHRQQLSVMAPRAELYYDLAQKRDPAQLDSPYFSAVMKIQFGQQHLAYQQLEPAEQLFNEAREKLLYVKKHAPYFVQTDYWLALLNKGNAMVKIARGEQHNFKEDLHLALTHLDAYEEIDPFFPEIPLESFFCHYQLGQKKQAIEELKKVLFLSLHYGSDLFRKDPRLDAIRVSQFLHQHLPESEKDEVEMILKLLHQFQSSTCLLPNLPKTQRHVKNSFYILQDPYGH